MFSFFPPPVQTLLVVIPTSPIDLSFLAEGADTIRCKLNINPFGFKGQVCQEFGGDLDGFLAK